MTTYLHILQQAFDNSLLMIQYCLTCHYHLPIYKYQKHHPWFHHTVNQAREEFRFIAIKKDMMIIIMIIWVTNQIYMPDHIQHHNFIHLTFLVTYICTHTSQSFFSFLPTHTVLIIQFSSVQFSFINVPSQQPDSQLQKQHNIETQITKYNKQGTYETNKANRINKSLITHYHNSLMIAYLRTIMCFFNIS
jgi:hypothetical protein